MESLVQIVAVLCLAFVSLANGQNCGFLVGGGGTTTSWPFPTEGSSFLEDEGPAADRLHPVGVPERKAEGRDSFGRFYIRETQSTQIPFAEFETYNMVFAHALSTYYRVELGDDGRAKFYVTSHFREYIDNLRDSNLDFRIYSRCTDGIRDDYVFVDIDDENTRAPQFSPSSMSLTVQQPWPTEIPINLQRPIFVRDLDYRVDNARVTLTASPDIVNPVMNPLFSGNQSPLGYDYRVELFLREGVSAGQYNVQLTATDGLYVIPYYISINVTDVVCKGQKRDPVFGKPKTSSTAAATKILYYNATIDSLPEEDDTLPGVLVHAFNPDDDVDACTIELSVNNDSGYLSVSAATGQVSFTRALTLVELEALGRTWIVEIVATEPESGKSAIVPLVITNDFGAVHANI